MLHKVESLTTKRKTRLSALSRGEWQSGRSTTSRPSSSSPVAELEPGAPWFHYWVHAGGKGKQLPRLSADPQGRGAGADEWPYLDSLGWRTQDGRIRTGRENLRQAVDATRLTHGP